MAKPRRLSVLLTNIWLDNHAGSEVVVRDMAIGLLRRGHRPIVYSPRLGRISREIAAHGVVTTDDLRTIAEPPDIIHAHHCIPCGEALIRFPQTPAIFVCHAFENWLEAPVHFPQIGLYVAVDEACRDRLVHQEGIAPDRVVILHNAVDLRRIPERLEPLGNKPRAALAFGKAADLPELRTACMTMGIAFEAIGGTMNHGFVHAEQELVKVDLVFASARSALEALCCGCAVVVCDRRGMFGLVTMDNFELLRANNFGLRILRETVTIEKCVESVARYDADDSYAVCQRARTACDLENSLDAFEAFYDEVLSGARRPQWEDAKRDEAVAGFLHAYLPRRPGDARWPWLAEREHLLEQLKSLEQQLNAAEMLRQNQLESLEQQLNAAEVLRQNQIGSLEEKLNAAESLKNSRLLKFGRLLRRFTGRPTPY
jgi:hypothetical protein